MFNTELLKESWAEPRASSGNGKACWIRASRNHSDVSVEEGGLWNDSDFSLSDFIMGLRHRAEGQTSGRE